MINLPQGVSQHLQTAKDFVNQGVNSLTTSAQQLGQSLKETAATTTDKAIDTVTTTLEQSRQTAEQIKNTSSGAITSAIAASFHDWLIQHPAFLRFFQILGWAGNHPIISIIILLFALALIWSIIKAIMRLIETASWSILQVPLKLILGLLQFSFLGLTRVSGLAVQKFIGDNDSALSPTTTETIYPTKQQRLAEISSRLEAIQQEQKELLQEAAELIASEPSEINIKEVNAQVKVG